MATKRSEARVLRPSRQISSSRPRPQPPSSSDDDDEAYPTKLIKVNVSSDEDFEIEYYETEDLDDNNDNIAEDIADNVEEVTVDVNADVVTAIKEETNDDQKYHCNKCNVQFASVEEHIAEFHPADVVMVKGEDGKLKKQPKHKVAKVEKKTVRRRYQSKSTKSCAICQYTFTSVEDSEIHYQVQHDGETMPNEKHVKLEPSKYQKIMPVPTYCEICDTKFPTAKSFRLHVRMHLPVKAITLEQSLKSGNAVAEAIEEDNEENDDDVRLSNEDGEADGGDSDDKEADNGAKANDAEPTTFGVSGRPTTDTFRCKICDKHFSNEFREIHEKSHKISAAEQHRCTWCNIFFESSMLLDMHMAAHGERKLPAQMDRGGVKQPYACSYCEKSFGRPHEKVKHERIHTGEKPHGCDICGKTFRVAYCLTMHMRSHTNVRPYACPHCDKRYKSHSVYNHHLATHSDARPHQCPLCPKAFKTAVQLTGHKNSHTKPFPCGICNRPFSTMYAVKLHMKGHEMNASKMKNVCRHCGANYTRAFALANHMKEQHPNEPADDVETAAAKAAAGGKTGGTADGNKTAARGKRQPKQPSALPVEEVAEVEVHEEEAEDRENGQEMHEEAVEYEENGMVEMEAMNENDLVVMFKNEEDLIIMDDVIDEEDCDGGIVESMVTDGGEMIEVTEEVVDFMY